MTQEERDFITAFIQRVGGPVAAPQGFATRFGGSVPATVPQSVLPPMDREADALLAELFTRHPEARYRISQLAFVQEQALAEAQNRLARMEWEMEQTRAAAPPPQQLASPWGQPQAQSQVQTQVQPQAQPPQSRGIFGGLFGGRSAPPQPQNAPPQQFRQPPQPQYPPGYQPGMMQQQGGSGFLGTALTTAAGVAGGMLAANALTSMFSGGGHGAHAATPVSSPVSQPQADPFASGGAPKSDTGWTDPSAGAGAGGWSTPASSPGFDAPQDTGWADTADSGGWSDPDQEA